MSDIEDNKLSLEQETNRNTALNHLQEYAGR
jgi:hypothetical protein